MITSPRATRMTAGALLLACAALSAPGCDAIKKALNKKKKWKTIHATDGRSEIRIPGAWEKTTNINELASVQAQHFGTASFLLVMTEDKRDFAPYTLEKYSKLVRGMMKGKAEEYVERGPKKLSIGPYKAIQYELRATVMGFKQRMLHTCVEGTHYTHQVLLWTNAKHWSKQQALFHKVLKSFREHKGPKTSPGSATGPVALKTVKARDGVTSLRVPKTWQTLPQLNKLASIREGDPRRNHYVVVITEAKVSVPTKSLKAYADKVFGMMKTNIKAYQATAAQPMTLAGRPGLQREISGNAGGVRLTYLATVVEGPAHYHQVLAWSLASAWPTAKSLFYRLTKTFQPMATTK